jgi:hypothetical protein
MIDVRFVIAHSLWILGAAVALAAFSYYQWLAGEQQKPLRHVLRAAWGWKVSIAGAMILVASGFLLMEGTRWWERGLWLLVWAGAAFDLWRLRRQT